MAAVSKKVQREFNLFDQSPADLELKGKLEETIIGMLHPTSSTQQAQQYAIQMASHMSNYRDDRLFNCVMRLFMVSTSIKIRELIVKSFRVPYSAPALAFLGKRLRDRRP